MIARAVSLQETPAITSNAKEFAGTWHWMFQGHSFSTMILVQKDSGYTGSVTPSRIALDDKGKLSKADPSENSQPAPISKTNWKTMGFSSPSRMGNSPSSLLSP
jgi:hypothetical protein